MGMTESEARGKIKYRIANEMRKAGENKEEYEDLEIAIQALKEIREYRAIGTVEELQALKEVDDDLRLQYCYEDLSSSENRGYMQGYNKAIDEFAKCLKERWIETEDLNLSSEFFKFVDKVAEQMKGGATNERTGND